MWFLSQRIDAKRALVDSLQDVTQSERQSDWADARLAQERVKARLTDSTSVDLRNQAVQNDADLAMVARLDTVRLGKTPLFLQGMSDQPFRHEYEVAFAEGGYGSTDDPAQQVAARINRSNIRGALLDAVYDWTASSQTHRLSQWLDEILVRCDPTPVPWIARARKALYLQDQTALTQLLQEAPTDRICVRLFDSLALRLQDVGGDGIPYLIRMQRSRPDDFWTAFDLNRLLLETKAIG